MTRRFSIVAHNPNTIRQMREALAAGATGLEPDICFHADDGRFYVHELLPLGPLATFGIDTSLELQRYLEELVGLMAAGEAPLLDCLIFDTKNLDGSLLDVLRDCVDAVLAQQMRPLRLVYSCSSIETFRSFIALREARTREVIAIDAGVAPMELLELLRESDCVHRVGFASGSSIAAATGDDLLSVIGRLFAPRTFPPSLDYGRQAVSLRDETGFLSYVYAWTVRTEEEMRAFLDLGVDALICETAQIPLLWRLLQQQPYDGLYSMTRKSCDSDA